MWQCVLLLTMLAGTLANQCLFYDNYSGTQVPKEVAESADENKKTYCIAEVQPCDPNEGRRLDGSCNNLDHPQRGSTYTPFKRVLPPVFGPGFEPRPSQSGEPLPLCRKLRTSILPTGTRSDQTFTLLGPNFLLLIAHDLVHGQLATDQFAMPSCCASKSKRDPLCAPQKIPDDDPVHRFTDIRCYNMTNVKTFQYRGCLQNGTAPERIAKSTPLFDLSGIYGSLLKDALQKGRLFQRGMLKYEVEEGRVYPPTMRTTPTYCATNELPHETRCHDAPNPQINTLVGLNLFSIWFWRNHNRIASTLADLNPCWDDEKLYQTAKDINIAIAMQIFYYEFLPILLGRENLVRNSMVSEHPGFRDTYNKSIIPQMSLEFPYILRWIHLMQEGTLKLYDGAGNYVKQIPAVNLTERTGYLAVDNNIDYLTQGTFRQPSGKVDTVIDPQLADFVAGGLQRTADVGTLDLARGRLSGFPPYVKYREYCYGRPFKSLEDLSDLIENDNLELLRDLYKDVNDIDMLAGVWVEKPVSGGFAPPTFYCLVVEQLLRSMRADRHWYERPNRPHAFTLRQLLEVRKATVSQLLCDVGDKVTEIQPHGFLRAGSRNPMTSCKDIEKMDLTAWSDGACMEPKQ